MVAKGTERGRYQTLNYRAGLVPPLSPDDKGWFEELLRKQGLR